MRNIIVVGLERERAKLVKRLNEAQGNQHGMDGLAIGRARAQQLADCQDAIDRIDHNLRVIADADRS